MISFVSHENARQDKNSCSGLFMRTYCIFILNSVPKYYGTCTGTLIPVYLEAIISRPENRPALMFGCCLRLLADTGRSMVSKMKRIFCHCMRASMCACFLLVQVFATNFDIRTTTIELREAKITGEPSISDRSSRLRTEHRLNLLIPPASTRF